ncbi:transcriptional regulator DEF1-like [Oncorhynchus tshawytscha]|uniref:transcriptional regulator DEF1-like n=1 Tax=Oncorhynchus tshawytscha TaxID=74940 RepID=UPI001C3DE0A1|nr:transcriptional regulator DEF1-like [Oncorhynchus tshawytscha]
MAVMIGIAFSVSWLCCLLIGGITCSTSEGDWSPALDSNAAWLYAGSLRSLGYGNYKSQMQAQQKHPAAILRKELAPMSRQPQQVWYPGQMPLHQKQRAAEAQQQRQATTVPQQVWHQAHMLTEPPTAVPQQVWHPNQMLQKQSPASPQQVWHPAQKPLQQKLPTAVPQQVWHPAQMQQKQPTAVPQQVWHPSQMPLQQTQTTPVPQEAWHPAQIPQQKQLAPMPLLQKEPTTIAQQTQQVWHPAQMSKNRTATEPQQKQPSTTPQQAWHPAQNPLQQKQPATEPQQKELTAMPQKLQASILQQPPLVWHPSQFPQQKELAVEPQQVRYPAQMAQQLPNPIHQQLWHVAQISQQQLAPLSQQKHYESTEDASGSSQASIEQSGVIPISSYSSKSHYKNGRTVFSQISYTPREAMPVDSGNAPKDGYVSIGAPSIYPTLVKDSARKI